MSQQPGRLATWLINYWTARRRFPHPRRPGARPLVLSAYLVESGEARRGWRGFAERADVAAPLSTRCVWSVTAGERGGRGCAAQEGKGTPVAGRVPGAAEPQGSAATPVPRRCDLAAPLTRSHFVSVACRRAKRGTLRRGRAATPTRRAGRGARTSCGRGGPRPRSRTTRRGTGTCARSTCTQRRRRRRPEAAEAGPTGPAVGSVGGGGGLAAAPLRRARR